MPSPRPPGFLVRCDLACEDLYRGGGSWTMLRRRAGYPAPPAGADEERLGRALGRILHLDDLERIHLYTDVLARECPPAAAACEEAERRALAMLHFALWGVRDAPPTLDASLERLWKHPAIRAELRELLPLLADRVDHVAHPLDLGAAVPLRVHWESQSTTRAESPTGRRYRGHCGRGSWALLFVRKARKDATGVTAPHVFLGPAAYERHEGERPMAITWRLRFEMPAAFFRLWRLAA